MSPVPVQATIILVRTPDFLLPVLPLQPSQYHLPNCFLKQELDLITHTHITLLYSSRVSLLSMDNGHGAMTEQN